MEEKQYEDIKKTIDNITKDYNGYKNIPDNYPMIEVRIGDRNDANPKSGFKCIFPINKYNEVIYSYIRDNAINYYMSDEKNKENDFVFLYFFIDNELVGTHEFYYNKELIEEFDNSLKK